MNLKILSMGLFVLQTSIRNNTMNYMELCMRQTRNIRVFGKEPREWISITTPAGFLDDIRKGTNRFAKKASRHVFRTRKVI